MISFSIILMVTGGWADAERARTLAWSRADAAGNSGKLFVLLEPDDRLAPLTPVDQVVPFWDQVVDWAAIARR